MPFGSSPRLRGTERRRRIKKRLMRIIPAFAGNSCQEQQERRTGSDHPRVCGEQGAGEVHVEKPVRIIPAFAGNSKAGKPTRRPAADHPRVCGEQCGDGGPRNPSRGSSPRLRGTDEAADAGDAGHRIIPAFAGNSDVPRPMLFHWPDHPRVCGEQLGRKLVVQPEHGSSPRLRGTEGRRKWGSSIWRIIPAFAGNSSTMRRNRTASTDHPRVCGEQVNDHFGIGLVGGSSPRLRGTALQVSLRHELIRIIPAFAGNRIASGSWGSNNADHPRVCGEQLSFRLSSISADGSSPRLRGTARLRLPRKLRPRIIPAFAGNSVSRTVSKGPFADHPRVCGEQALAPLPFDAAAGSSPRLRGTGRSPHV